MTEQTHTYKIARVFSVMLIVLFLISFAYAGIVARWESLSGILWYPLSFLVWLIWLIHFVWLSSRHPPVFGKRLSPWVGLLSGIVLFIIAIKGAGQLGDIVRTHEVQKALDAGLREDCLKLLDKWPTNESRIITIEEYAKLPTSIKMLSPIVYVENNNIDYPSLPPNVGICKNGWGGFAMGIRIFRSDADANTFKANTIGDCERIAPGVYFWWHPT